MIKRHRIAALASAGILAVAGAGTAVAHPGPDVPPGHANASAAQERGDGPGNGHGRGGHCEIASERLLTAADHPRLARLAQRLAEAVKENGLTQAKADRIFAVVQARITVKVARRDARLAPVLALFGASDREALREAIEAAGGLRELAEQRGVDRDELRAARREGRVAARAALRDLCDSGAPPPQEAPATPEPSDEEPADPDVPAE